MSQFPVETGDIASIADGVNYLLSGPGGLGQDFAGFSAYTAAFLTGNFRIPFTYPSVSRVVSGVDAEFTIVVTPNYSGIDIGYTAVGADIGVGAVVTALDYDPARGYVVTLDLANTDDIDSATVVFYPPASIIKPINIDPPIACSSAVQLDDRTFQYNFATTQPSPPFANGNNLRGSGWANSFYNGNQGVIGTIKCTTDYVIFRTAGFYPGIGDDLAGGDVYVDNMGVAMSTDCNARVTTLGGTDRVFISAQLDNIISYNGSGDLSYRVQLNRYIGTPNFDPINPDYVFTLTATIAEKTYNFTGLTGPGVLPQVDTIFSTVVDSPGPGYYWYIVEVQFDTPNTIIVDSAEFSLRSISAQVVKQ
jgi:hypothetical protein